MEFEKKIINVNNIIDNQVWQKFIDLSNIYSVNSNDSEVLFLHCLLTELFNFSKKNGNYIYVYNTKKSDPLLLNLLKSVEELLPFCIVYSIPENYEIETLQEKKKHTYNFKKLQTFLRKSRLTKLWLKSKTDIDLRFLLFAPKYL